MNYFDQQGNLTEEGLMLYVEALKLDRLDELPEKVLQHIRSHPELEREAIELYSLIAEMDYKELGPHPRLDKKMPVIGRRRIIYRWAAAAAVALLAYFTVQLGPFRSSDPGMADTDPPPVDTLQDRIPDQPEQEIAEVPETTTPESTEPETPQKQIEEPQPDDRQLFAANFVADETLDGLIGMAVRGGELNVLNPANDTTLLVGENINFAWQYQSTDPSSLTFILLNNRGEILTSTTTASSNYQASSSFEPGLYYWKLETEDDLIHVGRFFIRSK